VVGDVVTGGVVVPVVVGAVGALVVAVGGTTPPVGDVSGGADTPVVLEGRSPDEIDEEVDADPPDDVPSAAWPSGVVQPVAATATAAIAAMAAAAGRRTFIVVPLPSGAARMPDGTLMPV
jgi:hypothetical protein